MQTTIDRAGRVVIPRALRDEIGLVAGQVEIVVDGAALRIQPFTGDALEERDGRLLIGATGQRIDDDVVHQLRRAGQR